MDDLHWLQTPGIDLSVADGRISFGAPAESDWFCDPRNDSVVTGAPVLVRYRGAGPVVLSANVDAEQASMFDAAGLFVHQTDDRWVKFALERSPLGESTVVTVRTAGRSDDCNHWVLDGTSGHMRVAVDERSVAFHLQDVDGTWRLVRYAALPQPGEFSIGLIVQSPTGGGVRGVFSDVTIEERVIEELRDGS